MKFFKIIALMGLVLSARVHAVGGPSFFSDLAPGMGADAFRVFHAKCISPQYQILAGIGINELQLQENPNNLHLAAMCQEERGVLSGMMGAVFNNEDVRKAGAIHRVVTERCILGIPPAHGGEPVRVPFATVIPDLHAALLADFPDMSQAERNMWIYFEGAHPLLNYNIRYAPVQADGNGWVDAGGIHFQHQPNQGGGLVDPVAMFAEAAPLIADLLHAVAAPGAAAAIAIG
jgi:hypothetical protein